MLLSADVLLVPVSAPEPWYRQRTTSVQKTAIVVIVTVASVATSPIRAAEDIRVATKAAVERDAASTTVGRSLATDLGDGVPLVAVDLTPGNLSIGQLQPTKLKKVSRKKAIVIVAVVATAAILIMYAIAIRGFSPVFHSLNDEEAGNVPVQAGHPPAAIRR